MGGDEGGRGGRVEMKNERGLEEERKRDKKYEGMGKGREIRRGSDTLARKE